MKILDFFMRRPTLFWSLVVGILIAGVLAFVQMPKLEDPAVAVKQARVVVVYPGANAHDVELEVAQTMEDALRALPDVKCVRSECQNGTGIFTVEFKMTVQQKDLEQHFDLLRRKVNDIKVSLPQGCYDPMVIDDMMDVYGIFYAITADGYSYPEMKKYADTLVNTLESFGVKTHILDICRGPSVTRYELQPQAGIKVSRIASGVPVGGDLEYIDEVTLLRALEGRVEL